MKRKRNPDTTIGTVRFGGPNPPDQAFFREMMVKSNPSRQQIARVSHLFLYVFHFQLCSTEVVTLNEDPAEDISKHEPAIRQGQPVPLCATKSRKPSNYELSALYSTCLARQRWFRPSTDDANELLTTVRQLDGTVTKAEPREIDEDKRKFFHVAHVLR